MRKVSYLLPTTFKEVEIQLLREALIFTGNNTTKAAAMLRVSRSGFIRSMHRYGIKKSDLSEIRESEAPAPVGQLSAES